MLISTDCWTEMPLNGFLKHLTADGYLCVTADGYLCVPKCIELPVWKTPQSKGWEFIVFIVNDISNDISNL